MTCPYCGGEMERGYIHKGGYIAWNPDERDLGLPEREKGGFYAEKNLLGMSRLLSHYCPACNIFVCFPSRRRGDE